MKFLNSLNVVLQAIILIAYPVQQISDFVCMEHILNSEQLSDASQAIVLDKKIEFQGCEVTMRSVLQRHGNVDHVLEPELFTNLVTEGTVLNIGIDCRRIQTIMQSGFWR